MQQRQGNTGKRSAEVPQHTLRCVGYALLTNRLPSPSLTSDTLPLHIVHHSLQRLHWLAQDLQSGEAGQGTHQSKGNVGFMHRQGGAEAHMPSNAQPASRLKQTLGM